MISRILINIPSGKLTWLWKDPPFLINWQWQFSIAMLNYQRVNLRFPMVFLWFSYGLPEGINHLINRNVRRIFFSRGCLSKSKKWSVSNFRFVFDDVEEPFESCFRNHLPHSQRKRHAGIWVCQRWYILPKEQFLLHHVFQFSTNPYIYIYSLFCLWLRVIFSGSAMRGWHGPF